MAARRSIPALLRSLGFCVTIAPTFARAANLSGVSLLVSLVRPLVTRLPTAPLRLPPDATWLQVFPFAPDNEPLDYNGGLHAVDVRFATRVQPAVVIHGGPRLHAFCAPPPRGERAEHEHVLPEHLLRTLLRVAKAGLLPAEWPGATFLGALTPDRLLDLRGSAANT